MMDTCPHYEKYSLGEMEETVFSKHVVTCDLCKQLLKEDARLMAISRSLYTPVEAPSLWQRIEETLTAESRPTPKWYQTVAFRTVYRMAAVLVLVVGLAVYFTNRPQQETELLTKSALNQVERNEKEYIKSIAQLEKQATNKMQDMHIELALLYRDRLDLIDAQIRRCEEALEVNPANTHIRRYMLAALQDKKETLVEILHSKNQTT